MLCIFFKSQQLWQPQRDSNPQFVVDTVKLLRKQQIPQKFYSIVSINPTDAVEYFLFCALEKNLN